MALRQAVTTTLARHPFTIDAWVLLPDHLHAIWTLTDGDSDYSRRWSMIKRLVTQRVGFDGAHGAPYGGVGSNDGDCRVRHAHQEHPVSRWKRREGNIWQRRFWEHLVRDEDDLRRCLDYLHWNPVKHGHVQRVADWPYSSFHRHVRAGWYEWDWGGLDEDEMNGFGE